jgi:hypothetical protein
MTDERANDDGVFIDYRHWRIHHAVEDPSARSVVESDQVGHRCVDIVFPVSDQPTCENHLPGQGLCYKALEWRRPLSNGWIVTVHQFYERLNGYPENEVPPVMLTLSDADDADDMAKRMSVSFGLDEAADVTAMLMSAGGPEMMVVARAGQAGCEETQ